MHCHQNMICIYIYIYQDTVKSRWRNLQPQDDLPWGHGMKALTNGDLTEGISMVYWE